MTKKDKVNPIFIIGGILLVFYLFTQTTFFGAFITTCENIEPETANGYYLEAINNNWTVINTGSTDYIVGNETLVLEISKTVSEDFSYYYVDIAPFSCDDVATYLNASSYNVGEIAGKEIYFDDTNYYFCNPKNSVLLYVTSLSNFDKYMGHYESCTVVEINETQEELNNAGYQEEVVVETTTTTTLQSDETMTESKSPFENKTVYIVLVVLILAVWYFFFEKGEKGIFKKF